MKPRQFCVNGEWYCQDLVHTGRGATRFQSWMSWLKLSLSPYETFA